MQKISTRQVVKLKKLSKRQSKNEVDDFIRAMKAKVKKDPAVIKKFQEYNVPIDDIDKVEVCFAPLDVSAKTKDMKIYINKSMLDDDSEVKDPTHYLVHELTHYLQQRTGNTKGHQNVKEYMDKPTEQEAFKVQIDFKERNEGEEEAKEYKEDLLDHHKLKGKKRKEIENKIT